MEMIKRITLVLCCVYGMAMLTGCSFQQRPYLDAALQAEAWLQEVSIETEQGTYWPVDPENPAKAPPNLYQGTAGVVLFYLELYHTTKKPEHLHKAEQGAAYLISTIPKNVPLPTTVGFYTGLAGTSYALEQTYQATGNNMYRQQAIKCLGWIEQAAEPKGAGVEWGGVTDIISGSAGIGIFLLYANEHMAYEPAKELAIKAGRRLMEQKIAAGDGVRWAMNDAYRAQNYFMPNFSHGTAGVSYFLASLYETTKEQEFLEGALSGAQHLANLDNREGLLFHHEPGAEDLYYLNWCHGPVGTTRLYFKLWELTGDAEWLEKMQLPAGAVMHSGIPEKQTPGFWNNVGQCCGSAGLAEHYLNLFLLTRRGEYLEFARHATEDLLARATPTESGGLKWIHAEHRARPDFLVAQTGYMQGAAGIGIWLLHLDAFDHGRKPIIKLPDSPFEF